MEILHASEYRRMPWKNGGGETQEIAVSPAGASLDALDWRISMASVAQDGPFSVFPGIDRTLCILDGAGMELDFGAEGVRTVTADADPFYFSAERPVHARLLAGPITDLNVMTRRSRYRHTVVRLAIGDVTRVAIAEQSLVFCERGEVSCSVAGEAEVQLRARDCASIHGAPRLLELSAARHASVYLIQFYPTAATPA